MAFVTRCIRRFLRAPDRDGWDAEAHAALMRYANQRSSSMFPVQALGTNPKVVARVLDKLPEWLESDDTFQFCVGTVMRSDPNAWRDARAEIIRTELAAYQQSRPIQIAAAGTVPRSKIVGGVTAPDSDVIQLTDRQQLAIGAFIGTSGYPSCTGTVIAPQTILTAAHCKVAKGAVFVIGPDVRFPLATATAVSSETHPRYLGPPQHDVTLVYVDKDLPVDPIPYTDPPAANQTVQCVGYGWTEVENTNSNTTRWWVTEPVTTVREGTFVVNGEGRHGLCFGDSGGPALVMTGSGPAVVGTVSQGATSCVGADTYATPASNKVWIDGIVNHWKSSPPSEAFPFKALLPWAVGAVLVALAWPRRRA